MKKNSRDPETGSKLRGTLSAFLFLVGFLAVMALFAVPMGLSNMLNTMMNTAYRLLVDTVLYIMAIAVLMGAISALLMEFGVIDLLNRLLSPLMKPLFGMPGASALGILSTYCSDNPAILALAEDRRYRAFFKAYQIPALTNIGTAFGMGLIVTSFVLGLESSAGPQVGLAALCGNLGAILGGIVSTRLMLHFTSKVLGKESEAVDVFPCAGQAGEETGGEKKSAALRFLQALMDGGSRGVTLGVAIIPGVLVICTIVMMLTNGASADGTYTGAAYEGIALLPVLADKITFLLKPLFGFSSPSCVAVPVTALGSAGAALGVIPGLVQEGQANCGDIAVFTAMCMCWSGYLSTHVSMMDVLKCGRFTGKAILSHTVGGLFAGFSAHWLFVLLS